MKKILRLYEEDIREIVMEHFDCKPSEIVSIYTEDVDDDENVTPIFYIEVELVNE